MDADEVIARASPDKPFWAYLTLDLLVGVLNRSVFHPFVCGIALLSLRGGLQVPYEAPEFQYTMYWTVFVCLLTLVEPISNRIAYGKSRDVDMEEEVIVITGGASGLGRTISEIYALRGASVAVLDKKPAKGENEVDGVNYYECDVSDGAAVKAAWAKINVDLGLPTVLINNAGVVDGKSFLEMTPEEAEKTFAVNTLSHYHTNSLFIPPLLKREDGGTLVTLSSVLGYLGASHLSAYSASKAALNAYHASLSAELASYPNIKTILVTPGQLSTDMFDGVEQSALAGFFGPVVDVQVLAMKIIKMIDNGDGGHLAEPAYARWVPFMFVFPSGLQKTIRKWTGVDTAMIGFRGVNGKTK